LLVKQRSSVLVHHKLTRIHYAFENIRKYYVIMTTLNDQRMTRTNTSKER